MTVASPLAYPGGRTLATWWKQLAPWQPDSFWFGQLLLHRLEALTRVHRSCSIEPLLFLVIRALDLAPASTPDQLDRHLHVGGQAVRQILRHLAEEHLVEAGSNGSWTL